MRAHAEEFRADGIETTPLVILGQIAKCILNEAERVGAELIVMGTHRHGAAFDLVVGGVRHAVLGQTTIPILFVPLRKP